MEEFARTCADVTEVAPLQVGVGACPGCARQVNGNVQAFCVTGKCAVVDVRTDAISTCTKDEDCVLRYATCCQSCAGGTIDSVVSIRGDRAADLTAQLCEGTESCDKCLPTFPPSTRSKCNAKGHCEVQKN